ncbi:MAG TPA: hypothetical protein VN653_13570 [Anaerolineales bacterium]|nr:hypothetical protein [Anaerolineales bacterium]
MPFGLWKKTPFEERLKELRLELKYFNSIIGGYPTKIRNVTEARQVRIRWNKTQLLVEKLLQEKPNSLEVKIALADLLRMGHNIDVSGAAQASDQLLKEIIKTNPSNFDAYYCLAKMYVTLDPKLAHDAESYFLKAENSAAPNVVSDIYQGLGFACLYQEKTSEAIGYFEKFLQLEGDAPHIHEIVVNLKAGKKAQIIAK